MNQILKKVPFIICSFIIILPLNSCFPNGSTNNSLTSDSSNIVSNTDLPSSINKTIMENIRIDANINIDYSLEWKSFDASYKIFSDQELTEVFLSQRSIVDTYKNSSVRIPSLEVVGYQFSDNSILNVEIGQMGFWQKKYLELDYSRETLGTTWIRPDIKEAFPNDNLSSIDKFEAIKSTDNTLKSLGINVSTPPSVYALDYSSLVASWEPYENKSGVEVTESPWGKEDEAYLFVYTALIDNLPLSSVSYIDKNQNIIFGGRIFAIVSKEGLIALEMNGLYTYTKTSLDTYATLIPLDKALETIKTKYENIILTSPITISDISLSLVPLSDPNNEKFILIPAYIFTVNQKIIHSKPGIEDSVANTTFPIIINAESGQEIVVDGVI